LLVEHAQLLPKESGLTQRLKDLVRPWLRLRHAPAEFQRNLVAWRVGGPGPRGCTRIGPPIQTPDCTLTWVRRRLIEADECFAKNRAEIERWHLAFLKAYVNGADLRDTAYWQEYLVPRMGPDGAERRAARFTNLYDSIAARGCHPGAYAWLADLASAPGLESHFGFRYFRFDGAHRISCMYMLGIRQIPCMVFSVRIKT
jgi:hypothetical protein